MNLASLTDWQRWRSPRSKRFWLVTLVIAYTLIGFFVVPWGLQKQMPTLGQDYLQREAHVERVAFNPWMLRLQLWGLRIVDTDSSNLVTVDELEVNLQVRSLARLALVFRDIVLVNPRITATRRSFADSNIGSWVEDLTATPADAPPAETTDDQDAEGLRLIIDNLNIRAATVKFTDQMPETEFTTLLGPIDMALADISTLPNESGAQTVTITTETGAELSWAGSLQISPFVSVGTVQLNGSPLPPVHRYFADQLNFALDSCCMELSLNYAVAATTDGGAEVDISNLDLALRDLRLLSLDKSTELLSLPELLVSGGTLAWPAATGRIASVQLNRVGLNTWLDAAGELNLTQLVNADAGEAAADVADSDPAAVDAGSDWNVTLDTLQVNDMQVAFADRQLMPAGELAISKLNLTLSQISTKPNTQAPLQLDAQLGGGGQLRLAGSVQVLPATDLSAELTVNELALTQLQPWLQSLAKVAINSGTVDLAGTLASNADETLTLNADIDVLGLKVSDTLENKPLIGWQRLQLDDMRLALDAAALELSAINFNAPFARLIIAQDASTNFAALVNTPEANATNAATPAEPAATEQPFVIKVGKTNITDGALDFSDLSLPLPFQANISELGGSLSALASNSSAPSTLALEGKVGEFGLTTIDGTLNVVDPTQQADIAVRFRNVNMPDLSPYTAEFAGRKIESGKLDLELEYVFDKRLMQGENSVTLRQFELGEKVDNPDAVDLPLGLAVALLRDVNGVIDLNLGVSGDLDDPKFSAGGIILKAFANLITKLVAAPFKLLGGLLPGGGEGVELDTIVFAAGRADLTPPEREKLAQLSTALTQRPALTLDVPGGFNTELDTPALQATMVEQQLEAELGQAASTADDAQLLKKTRRALERLNEAQGTLGELSLRELRTQFDVLDATTGASSFDELAYMEDLRERLASAQLVDTVQLETLAAARSAAIQAQLLQGEITNSRIRVGAAAPAAAADDGWIKIKLGLEVDETVAAAEPAAQ